MASMFEFELLRKKLISVSQGLDTEFQRNNYLNNFPPVFRLYVCNSHLLFKPFIFLAGLTSLRFSDLYSFKMADLKFQKIFQIKQCKTHNVIQIDLSFLSDNVCAALSHLPNFDQIFSYGQIKREFNRLHLKYNRNLKFDYKSNTHFFRHANASFWKSQLYPQKDIAKMLGHVDLTTQKAYIHAELFFY